MKLSICIPVYNQEVGTLVNALQKEIHAYAIDAEIILIDDASEDHYKNTNALLSVDQNIFLPNNIGRSAIRNLFLNYAHGDFLLFLDCDSQVVRGDFLKNYLDFLSKNPTALVVNGGRVISNKVPEKKYRLRWKYAIKRESIPIIEKTKNPYSAFQCNNFLVSKKLFSEILFNESCKGYGYEDVVFALELKMKKIEIQYIDNPILNNDWITNEAYLDKIKESSDNLSILFQQFSQIISKELKIIQFYLYLKAIKLERLFLFLFFIGQKTLYWLILKSFSLTALDIYKLGLFVQRQNLKK